MKKVKKIKKIPFSPMASNNTFHYRGISYLSIQLLKNSLDV